MAATRKVAGPSPKPGSAPEPPSPDANKTLDGLEASQETAAPDGSPEQAESSDAGPAEGAADAESPAGEGASAEPADPPADPFASAATETAADVQVATPEPAPVVPVIQIPELQQSFADYVYPKEARARYQAGDKSACHKDAQGFWREGPKPA